MVARKRNAAARQWPFWLLLAAWLCANCPSVAMHTTLVWMVEARSFTHQQRLTRDVALVLTGEKPSSPIADAVGRAQEKAPLKRLPPVPADTAGKKIELSLARTTEVLPIALRTKRYSIATWLCPEPRRSPPPHGRPRETNAA